MAEWPVKLRGAGITRSQNFSARPNSTDASAPYQLGDGAFGSEIKTNASAQFETEMHKVVQGVLSNQTQPAEAVASLAQTADTLKKKYS